MLNQRKDTVQKRMFKMLDYNTVNRKNLCNRRHEKLLQVYSKLNDQYVELLNMEKAA